MPDISNEVLVEKTVKEEDTKKEKKKKEPKQKKDKLSKTGVIKFVQHIALTAAVLSLFILVSSSTVIIKSAKGTQTYSLSASDEGRKYEDSVLFNTIFGNETSDILRLVTIRTQFETNGAYDPNKVIDVVAYNQRQLVNQELISNTVTAKYRLGDLLKWSRYGFEVDTVTKSQLSQSAHDLVYNSYDGQSYMELDDGTEEYELLINRYKTIDGLGLEETAHTWSEYNYLIDQIQVAADDLYQNYADYLKLTDYYKSAASNMRYYVICTDTKEPVIYTNTDIKDTDIKTVKSTFKAYGKYISFNHDTFVYNTNTAINESTFNSLMSKYEYSYPDKCQIFIAADMAMSVKDSIYTGAKGFNNYLPYYTQLLAVIIVCAVIYIVLLVIGTIKEGTVKVAEGPNYTRLTAFDNTPIELWCVLSAIFLYIVPVVFYLIFTSEYNDFYSISSDLYFRIALAACIFVYDVILLGLYYSLVRRIKGRNIWKPSLLKKIIDGCKNLFFNIYDNSNVIMRSWVPYCGLGFVNFILLLMAIGFNSARGFFLLLMIIFDITVGVLIYKQVSDRDKIIASMKKIIAGEFDTKSPASEFHGDNKEFAECVNSIGDSIKSAVEQSMKDERMKADLIANVSHDIRTPLTSIINYVDLIKRENISDDNLLSYIQVIDEKSQRLKTLTDDLIEASKVSSGNVELDLQRMNLPELLNQSLAEFSEKFENRNLTCVCRDEKAQNTVIMADGKSLWRVIENLFGNVCKYAMPGSRVFIDLFNTNANNKELIVLQIKNISENPLPNDLDGLTERFIRGDVSRTSEGSGLGLSIAKSLTELMGGSFELNSDADLFKAQIAFEVVK